MSSPIVASPVIQRRASLPSLFSPGEQMAKLVLGSEKALRYSFEQRPMQNGAITDTEKKRRAAMCIEIARVLRGDCKWSVDKVADYLPRYLLNELDGIDWKPDKRQVWTPD